MPQINALCENHNVERLYIFGSVLTDKFNSESDVDFAVSFFDVPLNNYADNYFDLKNGLQKAVGRSVDLVEYKSISNPYFQRSLDLSKKLIYG